MILHDGQVILSQPWKSNPVHHVEVNLVESDGDGSNELIPDALYVIGPKSRLDMTPTTPPRPPHCLTLSPQNGVMMFLTAFFLITLVFLVVSVAINVCLYRQGGIQILNNFRQTACRRSVKNNNNTTERNNTSLTTVQQQQHNQIRRDQTANQVNKTDRDTTTEMGG
ncbi:hypothetical protein Pcinc_005552 [Petrolisthes cinctipes]|uniref:Uncharacterized protein n=1 Tax=Petrolisthes cinctipes TaxID=88211 RepID=A0AAE1GD76_PETCI|nr:hypothetical protein Pcinc_005552 [Petrolisthes cinctipes]